MICFLFVIDQASNMYIRDNKDEKTLGGIKLKLEWNQPLQHLL